MERHVADVRVNVIMAQAFEEGGLVLAGVENDEERVVIDFGPAWNDGDAHASLLHIGLEQLEIGSGHASTFRDDLIGVLELIQQHSRQHVGKEKARTQVNPAVLAADALQDEASIGALLLQEMRALHQRRIIDYQRATFAAADVLRLVEAERCQWWHASTWPPA